MTSELGKLQERWRNARRQEAITYEVTEPTEIPSEETLTELARCPESGYKTTCVLEGFCIYPKSQLCPYKK